MSKQDIIKNNYPFGELLAREFEKGDLVYWTEWKVVNKKLNRFKKIGVFLKKEIKFVGNREIIYAIVLCSETGNLISILAVRLKKEETN